MVRRRLRILNWNCSSLRLYLLELEDLLSEHDVDVACTIETFLSPEKEIFVSGFSSYRHDRPNSRVGGVAILVSSTIIYTQSPISITGANAVGVDIKHPKA